MAVADDAAFGGQAAAVRWVAGAAALLGAASGCAEENGRTFVVDNAAYRFPSAHVLAMTLEPHQFVRVSPPGERFDLVYDSRLGRNEGARPHPVYSVTDGPYPDVHFFSTEAGIVACRRASHPHGGCGMGIEIEGSRWSILFPEPLLPEAAAVRARAASLLGAYRTNGDVPS